MRIKSFNLPARYRLDFRIVKRRKNLDGRPLLLQLEVLRRVRKGSRVSRFLRHLFEHRRVRQVLGANLAMVAIAGSFAPNIQPSIDPSSVEVRNSVDTNVTTEKFIQHPTANTKINQGYAFYHPGIDFDGDTGDEVRPFKNGIVSEVGYSTFGYGNAILIDHNEGVTSLYAHLSQILVQKGDEVNTNSVIGLVGSTGRSTGAHLHFEIRANGVSVNPFTYLP